MPTDYNSIASQYKKAKFQPWRRFIEHYTFFELLGDLKGKTVLDLACGEGFFTRFLKQAGASRVVGVDISQGMIQLAREEENRRPLGIEYLVHDVTTLHLQEKFDVVTAAYLLNYARTPEELLAMGLAVAESLKPGSRFVTVNNNPGVETFEGRKYGFRKSFSGDLQEGTPIAWTIFLEEGSLEIINYHLDVATHGEILGQAGLRDLHWHGPRLAPAGEAELGRGFWSHFLEQPPVIFLECRKE
jgi:2-polyprenyl-3-methyl-5-hydroxy-6-metoxy-1,4-benzoquinol methylase